MPSDMPTPASVATIPHFRVIAFVGGATITLLVLLLTKTLLQQLTGH